MESGARLGPYTIDHELGSGGMGKVYAATVAERAPGLTVGDRVALKVVHPHLLATQGFFMRFLREARIGASIQHENVVRTYMCDQLLVGGTHHSFLVMEYVEGQDLRGLLKELERVPEELCRHVAREICKGLGAIHEKGVVHRDLKPENVLITPDHVVKVMDLGVAQLTEESIRLSQSGAFVGSADYAAPEQFKGANVDARTDLYALGVLLYEIASGAHPNRVGGFHDMLRRVLHEEPRPLGDVNPQLSAFFEEVVHTLLVKDPRGRFASAAETLAVLEEGEESEWWRTRSRHLREQTRRPVRRIRVPRETAVYGREPELETLCGLFARARSGDGQVVLLEGEAGIGKSRLVDELVRRLQADGEDLSFLFGTYPPGGAASAVDAFTTAFHEHLGDTEVATYLPQTPLLATAFAAFLRGDAAPPEAQHLSQTALATCLVQTTRQLAAERTTVLLIDDLHFAPDEARAVFMSLATAIAGHRVLLIGTTRRGASKEWVAGLTRLPQTTPITVGRLGPKDLVRLLGDSLQSPHLAEELAGKIAVKSDGNPFFAFEIIRGLREGRLLTQKDDGTWVTTREIDEIRIPSSVLDLVNARVAALTAAERDLLDVACCAGFEFDPLLIGHVLGLDRVPLLKSLGQIERQHRLVRSVGLRYVFDHHQVQEALYGSLSELLRREYHAVLAEGLEAMTGAAAADPAVLDGALCVSLCEHFLRGDRGKSALRYLPAAQSHLAEGYQHARMVELTERALAIPGLLTGISRARVVLRLGDVSGPLESMGRPARQEEYAREADQLAREAGDEELRVAAAMALGWCSFRTGRHREAEETYRGVQAIAAASANRRDEARALSGLSAVLLATGRLAEARSHYERQLELARQVGSLQGEASATGSLGNVCFAERRLDEARMHYERSRALSVETGDLQGEAIAEVNLGMAYHSEDRLSAACAHYERSLALNREIGNRPGEVLATRKLGAACHSAGRLAEARAHFERCLATMRDVGDRRGEAGMLARLALVLRDEGETVRCETQLEASLARSDELGDRRLAAVVQLELGSLRAARCVTGGSGEAAAREALTAARDLAEDVGDAGVLTRARCELARLPGGDAADALAALADHGDRLDVEERRAALHLLWKVTADRTHLEAAKRLLDESLAKAPAEYQEAMCKNLRVNREILAAWSGESAPDDIDDDEPRGTESVTRIG